MKRDLTNVIGYIYKITAPNGKIYIGQTINKRNRRNIYKNKHFKGQLKLWNSCEKYNWNPLDTFEVIEECLCGENKTLLNEREIYWIKIYNSFINGLNCTMGGGSYIPSKESREKNRIAKLGKKLSEEHKKKISKGLLGNVREKHSPETIEKMKRVQKERFDNMTEEERNVFNKKNVGRKQTQEEIETRRLKNFGGKRTEEFKKATSLLHSGRVLSDEHKKKLSQAKLGKTSNMKGKNLSEDAKQKLRQANIGKKLSKETIDKRNETRKLNKFLLTQESVEINEQIHKQNTQRSEHKLSERS